jgi:opacity protein-like surface antigen
MVMRRLIVVLGLCAAGSLLATPASAQVQHNHWFVNAGVGPSFGTLGSTPAADASAGYKLNEHLAITGEFGVLPHAPFDKAGSLAPSLSPFTPTSDVHVNAYHVNANLVMQAAPLGRFVPYATAGIGSFTGSTVASGDLGGSRLVQYDRDTNFATNLGIGTTYRLSKWFGLNADYRHFIVNATDRQHVNRFTTGVSIFVN